MCYFITIGISAEKSQGLIDALREKTGTSPQRNRSILQAMGPDIATISLSQGAGCCCCWYSANKNRKQRLERKYAAKGWSKGKIDRAIAAATAGDFVGLHPEIREALAGIAESLGEFSLIIHWYNGTLDDESLKIVRGPSFTPGELRQEGGAAILEDQIVHVKRK